MKRYVVVAVLALVMSAFVAAQANAGCGTNGVPCPDPKVIEACGTNGIPCPDDK